MEPPGTLQKPFNPVLGETSRTDVMLTGGTTVRKLSEQVSHHPPVSAFHCEAEGWSMYGHFQPIPRLSG